MSEKLKPCPFCGENAELEWALIDSNRKVHVWCAKCGADGPLADSMEEATAVWNKRAGRNETIEECAKIADNHKCTGLCDDDGFGQMCDDVIATEIRALAEEK